MSEFEKSQPLSVVMYLKLVEEGASDLRDLLTVLQDTLLRENIGVYDANSFEALVNRKYSIIF